MTERPRPYLVRRWVRLRGRNREPLILAIDDPSAPDGVAHWRIADMELRGDGHVRAPSPISNAPPFRIFTRYKPSGYTRKPIERRAARLLPGEERRQLTEPIVAQFHRAEPWAPPEAWPDRRRDPQRIRGPRRRTS